MVKHSPKKFSLYVFPFIHIILCNSSFASGKMHLIICIPTLHFILYIFVYTFSSVLNITVETHWWPTNRPTDQLTDWPQKAVFSSIFKISKRPISFYQNWISTLAFLKQIVITSFQSPPWLRLIIEKFKLANLALINFQYICMSQFSS